MSGSMLQRPGFDPGAPDADPGEMAKPLERYLRITCQVVGLILVLIGSYYGLSILFDGLRFVRNPTELEPVVGKMTTVLGLDQASVVFGEEKVPIGRTVAGVMVLLCYLLCCLVTYLVINIGGRLLLGVVAERREFLAAMKEFLISLRTQEAQFPSRGAGIPGAPPPNSNAG